MLRTLFENRSSRSPSPARTVRPRLEALEDRLALQAGMVSPVSADYGPGGGTVATSAAGASDYGYFAQQTLQAYGLPPSAYGLYALGGAPVSGYVAVPNQPVGAANGGGAVAAGLGTSTGIGGGGGGSPANLIGQFESVIADLYQVAAMENPQQANSLVMDEISRGVDSYINQLGQSIGSNNLVQGQLSSVQNAINQNPLEHGPVGQMLGNLVYDLTYYMYSTGQASGF